MKDSSKNKIFTILIIGWMDGIQAKENVTRNRRTSVDSAFPFLGHAGNGCIQKEVLKGITCY